MGQPQLMGRALRQLLRDLGIDKKLKQEEALGRWAGVVGPRIAGLTEPLRVEGGKLWVRVKRSTWRQELQLKKLDIIKKLNSSIGSRIIKDIHFV